MSKLSILARDLFGSEGWTVAHPVIEIRDLSGALLFNDYQLSSNSGVSAWIRYFAPTPDAVVSAELGVHPALAVADFRRFANRTSPDIESLTHNLDGMAALYCYHYPSLGYLLSDGNTQKIVDLIDGARFTIDEAGSESVTEENRSPYSFLTHIGEAGAPGTFEVPSESFKIPGVLFGQEADNWCAAASCQMILAYFGITCTQKEIAEKMAIPENPSQGGASADKQLQVFNSLLPAHLHALLDLDPTGAECVNSLMLNRPVKIGIWRHAQTVFGWQKSGDNILYVVHDPLPVGTGSVKFQNPQIVWSINHITILPKGEMQMSQVKEALQDILGMPLPDVLKKYADKLTPEEAELLRKLTPEDLENMRKSDSVIGGALGESGGGEGCGVYY